MSDNDHIEMLTVLKQHKGFVVLSGYDNEIYNNMLNNWNTDTIVERVQSGAKSFEYRRDDRNYKVGDVLTLAEFDPVQKDFTGKVINSKITYILRGAFGLPNGYCVLSLGKIW